MVTSCPATSSDTGPVMAVHRIRRNFSRPVATWVTYGEVRANLVGRPGQAVSKLQQYVERGSAELHYLRKIIESGAFGLQPPQNYAAMATDIHKWGEF